MKRSIVQIVPGAPPMINGVGDYAFAIARELREVWRVESTFLVCSPHWHGNESTDGFTTLPLRARSANALHQALGGMPAAHARPANVLLQLSPYGFDVNGSPFWLLHGLSEWKAAGLDGRRLVTFFHELYATSMPWRRGFWASPFQRICARAFARLSDVAITTIGRYAMRLEAWDRRKRGRVMRFPVPSNVGESPVAPGTGPRSKRVVVWGSALAKQHIYGPHLQELERAVRAVCAREIVDIGPSAADAPARVAGAPLLARGVLSAEDIGTELESAALGVLSYNPAFLGKSGVFAAMCAHGTPALCLALPGSTEDEADGIQRGIHYLSSVPAADVDATLDRLAGAAYDWYRHHTVAEHGRAIAEALEMAA